MQGTSTLKNIARHFRKNPTRAEALLWKNLRARQIEGLKFRRQHPIGGCIADFACLNKRIVIEADGCQHRGKGDLRKYSHLKGQGFKVLRFWDEEIVTNMGEVLEEIRRNCR